MERSLAEADERYHRALRDMRKAILAEIVHAASRQAAVQNSSLNRGAMGCERTQLHDAPWIGELLC